MDALTKWSETTAAKTRPRLSLKRVALLGLACILVLATAGYGYYWWAVDRFFQSTDDAYVGGDVTPIAPHIAGFIAEIPVADNQLVHAGQLLVRLDDRDVRAAADHAEAVLDQRAATLASLRAKYDLQQSAIRQASADLDAKSAQADFAKVDADALPHARAFQLWFAAGRRANFRPRPTGKGGSRRRRKPHWPRQNSNSASWMPILLGLQPPLPKRGPISKPHGSTSVTQKSARRLTAISAIARRRSEPMSRKALIC